MWEGPASPPLSTLTSWHRASCAWSWHAKPQCVQQESLLNCSPLPLIVRAAGQPIKPARKSSNLFTLEKRISFAGVWAGRTGTVIRDTQSSSWGTLRLLCVFSPLTRMDTTVSQSNTIKLTPRTNILGLTVRTVMELHLRPICHLESAPWVSLSFLPDGCWGIR
jgi:hypothetical protein